MKRRLLKQFSIGLIIQLTSGLVYAQGDSRNPADWYQRAWEDLETAILAHEHTDSYGQVCFLAHQAVEKMLKGVLWRQGVEPERTYRTVDLLKRFDEKEEFQSFVKALRRLDGFYTPSRYPKQNVVLTQSDASDCLETSKQFIDVLKGKL